jgi:glutathione reductase (NADPH)
LADYDYDLFVIGGGSGGVRASRVAASLGAKVAVAEERYFGGTCVNVGCVPKKLFSYAAHYFDDFADSRGFGWQTPQIPFDWSILKRNKDCEIKRLEGIYQSILESNNVSIFTDRARIRGRNTVSVAGKTVTARNILIATGGWPWVPDIPGAKHFMNSNDLFAMESLPESMVIIGGGYIAVEFASIFSRLGCKTTLVYRGDQLLRGFDNDIRQFISAEIGRSLELKLGASPTEITNNNNQLEVVLDNGERLSCAAALAATGRKPMTTDLGLETVNIQTTKNGAIVVDHQFQTNEPGIYAVGDVIDRVALTPVALAEGQLVARALFADQNRQLDYKNIPSAVFCQPNIATVGLSEEQARDAGTDVEIYLATVKQLKHTLSGRDEMSMLKLVVNKTDNKVLGVHMAGPDAGELVQGFAVALNSGATKADFDNTIGIHPTLAEEFVTMRTAKKSHA